MILCCCQTSLCLSVCRRLVDTVLLSDFTVSLSLSPPCWYCAAVRLHCVSQSVAALLILCCCQISLCLSVCRRLVGTVLLSYFSVSLSLEPPCWYCAAVRFHCVSQSVAALLVLCCCQTSLCLSVCRRLVGTVLLSDFTVSLSLSPPCWYCAAVRLHCVSQSVAALLILCCCQISLCLSVCRRLVGTVLLSDFSVSLSLEPPCWYCAAVRFHCVSQSVAALLVLCCCQISLCLSVCRRLVGTVLLSDFTVSLSLSPPCWYCAAVRLHCVSQSGAALLVLCCCQISLCLSVCRRLVGTVLLSDFSVSLSLEPPCWYCAAVRFHCVSQSVAALLVLCCCQTSLCLSVCRRLVRTVLLSGFTVSLSLSPPC